MSSSQCDWDLRGVGEVATGDMSEHGFHPMYAKGTPHGVCLRLEPTRGTIVTKWDGSDLHTPIVLHGDIRTVVDRWCAIISHIKNPTEDDVDQVVVSALINITTPPPDEEDTFSLNPGDFVAYLIPDIPACRQDQLFITRVVSVKPFQLANNHHHTLFSGGRGEMARYNPTTKRVVFPVKNLSSILCQ